MHCSALLYFGLPCLGIFLGTGSDSSANCLLMSTGSFFCSGGEQYGLNASIMQLRHGQLAEVLLVPLLIITEVVPLLIITELVRRLPEAENGCYFLFLFCCYFAAAVAVVFWKTMVSGLTCVSGPRGELPTVLS